MLKTAIKREEDREQMIAESPAMRECVQDDREGGARPIFPS